MNRIKEKLNALKLAIRNNQGFTFVELLIVLTILAILGTIAITNYSSLVPGAKIKVAKSNIKTFELALKAYHFRFDQYPTTEEGLQKLGEVGLIENPKEALNDPWGKPYNYRYPGIYSDKPEIWSYGADGKEGGEGDNADITNWE